MSITKDLQVFSFFQIEIETTIGDSVKDMFTKDELKKIDLNKKIKVRNNDSIITPKNWSEYKDVFFKQRMSYYKASYTENEKIKLELEDLNKLTISSPDYKILKKRYKKYLKALLNSELPQQTETTKETNKPDVKRTLFDYILNVKDKQAFINELKTTFNSAKGRTIKALINILKEAEILVIPDREFKMFLDLLRPEFTQNIGSYTGINDAEKTRPFDHQFLQPIKQKLKPLIDKHKST